VLVHTGQHYDENMSDIFFRDLQLPEPDYNLGVGSALHGAQTGDMLTKIEEVLLRERPDRVLVYGDTNSTLAGALAAVKLDIPVAHIEAGLRSFNRQMPEEINRVVTDHVSTLIFCPTKSAAFNLAREGILKGVHLVGDVMYDAVLHFAGIANQHSHILDDLDLKPKEFVLATVHRASNTDIGENLRNIFTVLSEMHEQVIFPVHPRTRRCLAKLGLKNNRSLNGHLRLLEPVGYLDMLILEQNSRLILTDSGGIQKEAYFFGVPCITLRAETEWVETVETGWNIVAGSNSLDILKAVNRRDWPQDAPPALFGDGQAAARIASILTEQ
jgi:UDP-N-acetylglucosamine 2-epimerase